MSAGLLPVLLLVAFRLLLFFFVSKRSSGRINNTLASWICTFSTSLYKIMIATDLASQLLERLSCCGEGSELSSPLGGPISVRSWDQQRPLRVARVESSRQFAQESEALIRPATSGGCARVRSSNARTDGSDGRTDGLVPDNPASLNSPSSSTTAI